MGPCSCGHETCKTCNLVSKNASKTFELYVFAYFKNKNGKCVINLVYVGTCTCCSTLSVAFRRAEALSTSVLIPSSSLSTLLSSVG